MSNCPGQLFTHTHKYLIATGRESSVFNFLTLFTVLIHLYAKIKIQKHALNARVTFFLFS